MCTVWYVDKYKITFKLSIPGESLAARYNCCQVPVPGRGPAVKKRCFNVCALLEETFQWLRRTAAHKLNQIITEYGLTISVQKTKLMACKGRGPVRTKIVVDNKIINK